MSKPIKVRPKPSTAIMPGMVGKRPMEMAGDCGQMRFPDHKGTGKGKGMPHRGDK